jgi:hypothetical protein
LQHFVAGVKATILVGEMVEEVHVEVSVHVIIEEEGLGAEAGEVEAVGSGFVFVEGHAVFVYALADEQLVMAVEGLMVADPADVDIQEPIVIDVHDGDACGPAAVLRDLCFGGDVPEMEAAIVEVEFIIALVGCEEEVYAAIVVKVPGANAAAIVIVHVLKYVEFCGGGELIVEVQAGPGIVEHLEERLLLVRGRMAAR